MRIFRNKKEEAILSSNRNRCFLIHGIEGSRILLSTNFKDESLQVSSSKAGIPDQVLVNPNLELRKDSDDLENFRLENLRSQQSLGHSCHGFRITVLLATVACSSGYKLRFFYPSSWSIAVYSSPQYSP
ncbi:hypothetical protein L3Y34_002509 [Caenorhabditis briggsae]|uniref:Uncharacterized protein n=1 Tax=Caenorhabditis briggsae TaxID=6238 RepID=A0AAE9DGF1_CAEBR|nr:hypothetical protein L3Y34_002509 [Caenorhabditis briggsae]